MHLTAGGALVAVKRRSVNSSTKVRISLYIFHKWKNDSEHVQKAENRAFQFDVFLSNTKGPNYNFIFDASSRSMNSE
jgi:hypothetical protein